MTIDEKTITLKDGRTAIVRSPRMEDVHGVLDYLYATACETEFVIRYPEECGVYTEEGERLFLERVSSADNEAMLVCIIGGAVAATCQVSWSNFIKLRHRASVAIAVRREYWGLGIGTRLMRELIDIAERNPNITQIELDFIEGNSRARALYERLGFRIAGVRPNAIRLKDGTLLNEYSMILPVER